MFSNPNKWHTQGFIERADSTVLQGKNGEGLLAHESQINDFVYFWVKGKTLKIALRFLFQQNDNPVHSFS